MAGPRTPIDYTSDTGAVYLIKMPTWQATLLGVSTGTATAPPPKGLRKRVRYVRVTATGREHKVVVPDIGLTHWTDPFGTSVTIPTLGSGTATACTLEGRTGERTKNI
jgi:hypothetical protein